MPKQKRKPPAPPKFAVGDHVRVKHGIKDMDYPDMPLGGWAGAISEVHKKGRYTVRWNQETLKAIHPVFKSRCERDGLDFEEYGFGADELEPDPGGPLSIEQPKEIKTKPLSPKDQDDRIRAVFGLTSDDPLPNVDEDTLLKYHEYLSENMSFPFEMDYSEETGPFEDKNHFVKVVGLLDPERNGCDEMYGLICRVKEDRKTFELPLSKFEPDDETPEERMLADYCSWFWNNR